MRRKFAKGTVQLGQSIDEDLMEQLRGFASEREETLRHVIEEALRRHMAFPPPKRKPEPPPPEPFLDSPSAGVRFKGKRK
jgi:hypothetical protein